MSVIRAGARPFVWLIAALFLAACSSGDGAQFPAPVWPQPQPQPAPAAPRSAAPPGPEAVRAEMARWFSGAGYPPAQVAALIDYAKMESGFRPCAVNGAGYRYTFQWSGLRLRRLAEFSGTNGCPHLAKQLAFADRELRNEPNYSCFWQATSKTAAFAALRRGFGYGRC